MSSSSILFAGDFCFDDKATEVFRQKGSKYIYGDFLPCLKDADIAVVNLECPLTNSNEAITKTGPNLKGSPELAILLQAGGINVATLANNHILDFGAQGLKDSLHYCKQHSIQTVGAGLNKAEALKILMLDMNDAKLAIINVCETEYSLAGENTAGANGFDYLDVWKQLQEAKKLSDFVFVVYHGGNEHYNLPSPRLKKALHYLIHIGADAVIAHHSHCYSGYELIDKKPIFYGLGNFLFNEKTSFSGWFEGYVVKFKLDKATGISFEINPYVQCKEQIGIRYMNELEKKQFYSRLKKLNEIINDDNRLQESWDTFSDENSYAYLSMIENLGFAKRVFRKLLKKFLGIKPRPKSNLTQMNIIRNEAHHEVLMRVLLNQKSKK